MGEWLGTYSSKVWNLVPTCLMWLVWKERNARTFEDVESPIDKLKTLLARTLFEWSRIWGFTHCNSLSDFLISISLSLWFDCICFKGSVFIIVNTLFFSSIKLLLSIKKKFHLGDTRKQLPYKGLSFLFVPFFFFFFFFSFISNACKKVFTHQLFHAPQMLKLTKVELKAYLVNWEPNKTKAIKSIIWS